MRKLILILWAGILSVFSISCYDDEGSNDYHPINEVKISDWKKGGYTAIFKNDTLKNHSAFLSGHRTERTCDTVYRRQ